MKRDNHYEAAFEWFLRDRGVAVEYAAIIDRFSHTDLWTRHRPFLLKCAAVAPSNLQG